MAESITNRPLPRVSLEKKIEIEVNKSKPIPIPQREDTRLMRLPEGKFDYYMGRYKLEQINNNVVNKKDEK